MKKTLTLVLCAALILTLIVPVSAADEYSDTAGLSAEIRQAIAEVTRQGLFTGYPDGSFLPDKNISRAEFAAVIVRCCGLEEQAAEAMKRPSAFSDVAEEHWAKGYLNLAHERGLLQGRGEGIFDPEAPALETEVAVTLLRYAGFSAEQLGKYPVDSNALALSLGLTAAFDFSGTVPASRSACAYMVSKIDAVEEAVTAGKLYFYDGQSQPVFAMSDMITEVVYVESPVDTDGDGRLDLIQVFIKRPAATEQGLKVAAIYQALPYETGTTDAYDEDSYNSHAVDAVFKAQESTGTKAEDFAYTSDLDRVNATGYTPEAAATAEEQAEAAASETSQAAWDNTYSTGAYDYWLARGYACVFAGGIGTLGSDGIAMTGSEEETAAFAAVIDWLNGRTAAYLNREGTLSVTADWCTGNVAMTGRSYGGTTAFSVAASGVEGLRTIIPLAGIANWYDYYRSQGTPAGAIYYPGDELSTLSRYVMSRMLDESDYPADVFEKAYAEVLKAEDRETGDYNAFWDERNTAANNSNLNCSALIIHGLNDFNVRPLQFQLMYQSFLDSGNEARLILHQGAHMTPAYLEGLDYQGIISRWLAHYLYGQDNGMPGALPAALVQSNTDLSWQRYTAWGGTGSETFNAGEGTAAFSSDLTPTGFNPAAEWAEYFSDEMYAWEEAIALDTTDAGIGYSFELTEELHISGTVQVTVSASLDRSTGILSAMLVDTAEGLEALWVNSSEVIPTEETGETVWLSGDLGSKPQVRFAKEAVPYKIITRGWMDVQNRDGSYRVSAVEPGKSYTFTINLQPIDYVVEAGHTLTLVLYSADAQVTYWPVDITTFTIDNSSTYMVVPTR